MRPTQNDNPSIRLSLRRVILAHALLIAALMSGTSGCAALTDPVADAVPVRHVPRELLAAPHEAEQTIPLNLLGQPRPPAYLLAAGDVLGVYIEGFLGDKGQPLPVNLAQRVQLRDLPRQQQQPALGYPVTVQEDGTVTLPLLPSPVAVKGLTIVQAAAAIRKAYVDKQLLKPEADRVLVSLMYPRQQHVVVFRQEAPNLLAGPDGVISNGKRGTGHDIDLPAYENDLLHALAESGGLPGLDAFNEILVYRYCFADGVSRDAVRQHLEAQPPDHGPLAVEPGVQIVRIPLRLPCGAPLPVRAEDVLLHTGDVVFLEARDNDVFYTAGLMPPGTHLLPRDHSLDVLAAVSQVRGPLVNGAFAVSNLSGTLINPGIGNPSPSLLVVVRRTPGGGQVPILVDLNVALRDPRERILIQPGDMLILQEKPEEALARYITQTFFNFDVVWQAFHSNFVSGVVDVAAPDRISGRLPTVNINQP